jgi:DUF4097 and DUF4098 domain-containing protein YvlB
MAEHTFHTPLPLTLEVTIPSGAIAIESVDGEESRIAIEGDERLLDEMEVRQEGSRVVVAYRGKGKFGFTISPFSLVFGDDKLRVRATVPHGAGVKVKTASADIAVDGRVGSLEVNSVSGDVRVRGTIEGDANLKTVSGDADLQGVGGNLTIHSVSGDVRAGSVTGSADAKSISGDIHLGTLTGGDVRFTSVSGDVEIGIAPGSLLDVDAGSTSGDLHSEVPLGSEPTGGDGPTVVLRGKTISGDVRVFRAA